MFSRSSRPHPEILIFACSSKGGLAEYIFYQGKALALLGAHVNVLSGPDFLEGREVAFGKRIIILGLLKAQKGRLLKKIALGWNLIISQWNLSWHAWRLRPDLILLDNYVEYLSPFWIWPHWFLAKVCKFRYAANLHDPVRSYVIGPKWWHQWSVNLAYKPLEFVTIHEHLSDPSVVPGGVRTFKVPHGLYEISGSVPDSAAIRSAWGIEPKAKVFLAFGFVRDGKNLDLSLRALASVPDAFLVVAGSVATPKDRQFADYRQLAAELGVASRCRFFEGFVADQELGKYFAAADFILLTYAATFHSQSGVLNLAARARKPVLVSSAPSAMLQSVRDFDLGVVVAPDSLEAVIFGMKALLSAPPKPRWDDYEALASWDANAREVFRVAGFPVKPIISPL